MNSFGALTATASQLQKLLRSNKLSGVQIVRTYLNQICNHNLEGMKLYALIATVRKEDPLKQAGELDEERVAGGSRDPLHAPGRLTTLLLLTH